MKCLSLSFALIAIFAAMPFAACENPVSMGSFSGSALDGWTFYEGKEFPGAQGNLAVVEDAGATGGFAAYLEGAFGLGGGYVSMSKNLPEPLPFKKLAFSVKTSDYESIKVRLVDGNGRTHQLTVELKDSEDWQSVSIEKVGGNGYITWGGAKDAKWRDPLKSVSLMLSVTGLKLGLKSGKAFFSAIKLER